MELGNAHRSGVCTNMKMSELKKQEFKDGYWMIYEMKHKSSHTSGHTAAIPT